VNIVLHHPVPTTYLVSHQHAIKVIANLAIKTSKVFTVGTVLVIMTQTVFLKLASMGNALIVLPHPHQ
jgi:hypothetical protein